MRSSRSVRPDAGMTLVEVVVTVVMLGLVMGVVSMALVTIFRAEDGVLASTAEAHDTSQIVSYFPFDVESGPLDASAYRATIGGAAGDHGSGCSETGNDNVLRIDILNDFTGAADERVAYRLVNTATTARIDRYDCARSGSTWIEQSVLNVADSLDRSATPIAVSEVVVDNPGSPAASQVVETVELRYVQRGATETIVATPRQEGYLSLGSTCLSSPTSPTRELGTFVTGDVQVVGTTVKSTLYVGGTFTFQGTMTFAQAVPETPTAPLDPNTGLVVGSVNWAGSSGAITMSPGRHVLIEDGAYHAPNKFGPIHATAAAAADPAAPFIALSGSSGSTSGEVLAPGATRVLDPADVLFDLRSCSDRLAELPGSCSNSCATHVGLPADYQGTALDQQNPTLTITAGKVNVFNIADSNLLDLQSKRIFLAGAGTLDATTPLIINVASDPGASLTFTMPQIQGQGSNARFLIWNFPNAASITIDATAGGNGGDVFGSILAPYADVTSNVSITGGVIAKSLVMRGASMNDNSTFDGTVAW